MNHKKWEPILKFESESPKKESDYQYLCLYCWDHVHSKLVYFQNKSQTQITLENFSFPCRFKNFDMFPWYMYPLKYHLLSTAEPSSILGLSNELPPFSISEKNDYECHTIIVRPNKDVWHDLCIFWVLPEVVQSYWQVRFRKRNWDLNMYNALFIPSWILN